MERIIYFVGFAVMFLIATQCGSRYNTIDFKDKNKGDERIYGEPGGPARQTKISYPEDTVQKRKSSRNKRKIVWRSCNQKNNVISIRNYKFYLG